MTRKQKQQKLAINTLIDMEETMLRLELKKDQELALDLLAAFRPDATLRQIKNSLPLEKRI